MSRLSTRAVAALALLLFALPAVSSASTLTTAQVNAVIGLLQAFDVDAAIVTRVEQELGFIPSASSGDPASNSAPAPVAVAHLPATGSPYTSSNLGYDLSYSTATYPGVMFNFGVIGVTGGKAFVNNNRLSSEVAWAQVSSVTAPTAYMNLNAPYGSTVAANIGGPKACPANIPIAGATSTEPTACEGYNYGYNAAAHSYAYAKTNGLASSLWWLDIEEANSWSPDTSVNDATIQGAIDYLNARDTRVGIYSILPMWDDIAGTTFVPTQTIGGNPVSIPNWFPIGLDTQVGALNTCVTDTGFIVGSPIWLIQYELNSIAVDQNIAC